MAHRVFRAGPSGHRTHSRTRRGSILCAGVMLLLGLWPGRMPRAAEVPAAAPVSTPAAAGEVGLPFIRNFNPAEYGGSPQNWSMAQGRDGVIYVGNVDSGVLAFDGVRWRRIPLPNRSTVRALATDANGRIYVGAVGEFGYLAPDASGQMRYVSLLDRVPAKERDFADVWSVFPTPEGVYFATLTRLFRLRGGEMKVWKPQGAFHLAFHVGGSIYIRELSRGLLMLKGDTLVPLPGGERFAKEKIYALLPWGTPTPGQPQALLIGTRTQGWFVYDGHDYRPWPTEADAAIKHDMLYNATWLADGELAVATLQGGVYLLDRQGHLRRHLDEADGLLNNVATSLFQDRQRGLWVTMDVGVARVDIDSPISHFDARSGLRGAVLALARHAGHLYAGTTQGLFRLDAEGEGGAHFVPIPQVPGQTWGLLEVGTDLLTASSQGVYQLGAGAPALVMPTENTVYSLLRSRRDPARVFVGMQDGLASMRELGGRWIREGRLAGVNAEPRTMLEDAAGRLWLGNWSNSVMRLTLPAAWPANGPHVPLRVETFGTAQGLPVDLTEVYPIDGEPRFATTAGVYRFDEASRRFMPDPRFAHLFATPRQVGPLLQDRQRTLWMFTSDEAAGSEATGAAVPTPDGSYRWQPSPLQPIAGSAMMTIDDDADGVLWFGGDKGLFRYDPAWRMPDRAPFQALVRKVVDRAGHPLAGGAPKLAYADNALRFEFAAPSYDAFEANRFQVTLQGLDQGWSPWSGEAYRDYTNIPAGEYRFRVRARNVYGTVGKEAQFRFRILAPWYRTGWAWLLWSALAGGVLWAGFRWRSAALRRHNQALAALVAQRTGELDSANQALRAANHALAEQSVTDPLTGLKNRRYLYDHIEHDIAIAQRHYLEAGLHPEQAHENIHLLFLMVDIDHFKEVNDTYGHAAGDSVLQQFRDVLLAATRETDTPVRWGGEEFLIVARFTHREAGCAFAERIRAMVAAREFDLGEGRMLKRTCSVGFASYPFCSDEPHRLHWEQVLNLADECLYAAKRSGRNAWVGVEPGEALPADRSIVQILHASLDGAMEAGPLRIRTSWQPGTSTQA